MVYQEIICQEQTHLPACDPITFAQHFDGVLELSLTQHFVYITLISIYVISFKWIVCPEKTCKKCAHISQYIYKRLRLGIKITVELLTQHLVDIA